MNNFFVKTKINEKFKIISTSKHISLSGYLIINKGQNLSCLTSYVMIMHSCLAGNDLQIFVNAVNFAVQN